MSAQKPDITDATLRQFVGYNMKRAFNVVAADLARTLKPFELRVMTFTTLVQICDNPGLRQSQLADSLEIERPNLVAIIDDLEDRGLITRDRVPSDRRAYALTPTPKGRRVSDQVLAEVEAHEHRLLQHLPPETRIQLLQILRQIETGPTQTD